MSNQCGCVSVLKMKLHPSSCYICGKPSPTGVGNAVMFFENGAQDHNDISTGPQIQRYLNEVYESRNHNTKITLHDMEVDPALHNTGAQFRWIKKEEDLLGPNTSLKELVKKFGICNKPAYHQPSIYKI